MAPALGKRLAVAGIIVFLTLIVYVWQSHLLPNVEKFLPIVHTDHTAVPIVPHKEIRCPSGFGEGQSKAFGNKTSAQPKGHQLVQAPKIVGLVFYGRRGTVSILDCYLKVRAAYNIFQTSRQSSGPFDLNLYWAFDLARQSLIKPDVHFTDSLRSAI